VALISYTPDPELIIATAARISYSSSTINGLREKLTPEQAGCLIKQLLSSGHLSPFEHASFTFAIEGISRVTSHQLVRHRLASYTQQSQRYVSLKKKLDYVTPPSIIHRRKEDAYRKAVDAAHQLYCEMVESDIPAEDARYILPQAVHTQLAMTMNARELMHACSLRLCLRAQWEIVQLFQQIKDEIRKVAPLIGEELNPKCYLLGYCDESESCGLFPTRDPAKAQINR